MYVELIIGPMWANKTSELYIKHIQYSKKKDTRLLVVKPKLDTRNTETSIRTHNGQTMSAMSTEKLMSIDVSQYDVILIDEAQWFPDLYQFVKFYISSDLKVHIAGLSGDKYQQSFGQVMDIIPLCSNVIFKHSICEICGDEAPFTLCRLDTAKRDIPGDGELYYTVCHKHLSSDQKWQRTKSRTRLVQQSSSHSGRKHLKKSISYFLAKSSRWTSLRVHTSSSSLLLISRSGRRSKSSTASTSTK